MSTVELIEILRNLGLLILAAFGVSFAAKQLARARARDAMDLYVRASEWLSSDDSSLRMRGYLLMQRLKSNPETERLAFIAMQAYIETASEEDLDLVKELAGNPAGHMKDL